MQNFHELFIKELKEIYSAEKQITAALPDMANAAASNKLKDAFMDHLKETHSQVKRLEEIARELNIDLSGSENEAIKGLLREGQKVIRSDYDSLVKDAALINCAQHIEHYEIASYGTLKAFAKHLKYKKIEELLDQSSKEEGRADKKLTELAEGTLFSSGINDQACKKCA